MSAVKLSILITTHNNEQQIARCLDSVLAQELSVPYEVIVSDDSSTDGTMAILRRYEKEHEGIMHVHSVCSDEIHPTMGLERAGWNKANVYMHAKGEYVVNLDGDDYLKGTDIYQWQIDQLEKHPECVACMQNLVVVEDGKSWEEGEYWRQYDLKEGDTFSFENYLEQRRYISHPAFMFRRDQELDAVKRYGRFFDDEFITLHHLQQGDIVYVHRADYVYVQYKTSLNHAYVALSRDVRCVCMPVIYGQFWEKNKYLFLRENLQMLQSLMRQILEYKGVPMQEDVIAYLQQFDSRLIRHLAKQRMNVCDRMYVWRTRMYVLLLNKLQPRNEVWYRILSIMMD